MCELGTLLTVASLAATAGSTVIGAMGAAQQGEAAQRSANYNAQVAEMNATLADRRAKDAIERGARDEQRKRLEVARIQGQQRAALAAGGIDMSFGSPLDTIVDSAVAGELDALTIRSNAYREAYDHRVDGTNRRASANLSRMEGENARQAGYMSAAGTVLTGVGTAARQYRSSSIGAIS